MQPSRLWPAHYSVLFKLSKFNFASVYRHRCSVAVNSCLDSLIPLRYIAIAGRIQQDIRRLGGAFVDHIARPLLLRYILLKHFGQ